MEIGFTPEQELLAETIRDVASRHGPKSTTELESTDPEKIWTALRQLGLPGLRVPEAAGGGGALVTDAMIVVEELSRRLVPVSYLGPLLGAELLAAAGAPTSMMSEIADGDRRYTVLLDSSLRALGRLDDPTAIAWDAEGATGAVALDALGRACVVDLDEEPLACADPTRTARRAGGRVMVGADELGSSLSPAALTTWTASALSLLAADLLGAMEAALAGAVAYSKERVQFGRPIGSFQAVQHICADAHVATEATRSGVWYAAWAADALAPAEALAAARGTKAYAAQHAVEVVEAAIQVHGGIAITWDTLPHLYLRRCLLARRVLGDEEDHYRALSITAQEAPA